MFTLRYVLASLLAVTVARGDFTVAILPDTQHYCQAYPEVFTSQTQWIKDNAESRNIVFVLHEGDIVNRGNSPSGDYQWDNADASISVLDGIVPYTLAVGNHDMGNGEAEDRDTTNYNIYFPYTRYESQPWYGGHMDDDNDNHYTFFRADGMDFMIVTLEFGPNCEMIDWANDVVSAHPEKRVIVLTHCYTYFDDTRVGPDDLWNPHTYPIDDIDDPHDGDEMWESFVRLHENIFLVLSGHILQDGLGRLVSVGDNGNLVHQVLANYQTLPNGGNGWLRLMTFIPSEDRIETTTYSPWLDEHAADAQNGFDLPYDMSLAGDADGDDDVDLMDFSEFLDCVTGPGAQGTPPGCDTMDLDVDGDVDLADMGTFQRLFTNAP